MALPPSNTSDETFMREVDEEVRRDRMLNIWQRYGKLIIGAIVLALIVLAGVLYFRSHTDRQAGKQGEQFDLALRDLGANQATKAEPALRKLSTEGEVGYRALARFAQADALLERQDSKGAAAKLGEIVADSKIPEPLRHRALVRQTMIEFDTLKPEVVIQRLQGLANPNSAWFGTAGELVAVAYLKQGKRAEAGKLLGQIAQAKSYVPDSIRARAVQMAGVLGVDAIDQTEEKKAQ